MKRLQTRTQTPSGIKRFSLKPGAVSRFYLTTKYRGMYLRQLRGMVGLDGLQQLNHPDLQPPKIMKNEAVESFMDLMENSWINPLASDQSDLINLATGITAPPDVITDLKIHEVGEEAYQNFKNAHLENGPPTVKFYEIMKKQNLTTFYHIQRNQIDEKTQGKQLVLKSNKNLFKHMITCTQTKNRKRMSPLQRSFQSCQQPS